MGPGLHLNSEKKQSLENQKKPGIVMLLVFFLDIETLLDTNVVMYR